MRRQRGVGLVRGCIGASIVLLAHLGGLSCAAGDDADHEASRVSGTPSNRYRLPVFDHVEVNENIVFRSVPHEDGSADELRLDVYLPARDTEGARPAIIWFHGGGFQPGEDRKQEYIVTLATEFARRGYVSVATDYRTRNYPILDWTGTLQDALDDGHAALDWVRSHSTAYGIDPNWIALGGGSAGGMIAVHLAAVENEAAAKSTRRGVFALVDLWGTPPLGFGPGEVTARFPPTVIIHGTSDKELPFFLSERLAARLTQVGVNHLLHPIAGGPHTPIAHMHEIVDVSAEFLYSLVTLGARS